MHPYLRLEHPIRFAHRGSRLLWPENTKLAFQRAIDLGYRYIETDVRLTADRVVVVFHDRTLDRTTNSFGKIEEWEWADLEKLDAGFEHGPEQGFPYRGKGACIPRLDDVLSTWPDVYFNIDLKAPRVEWAAAEVIKQLRRSDTVLVGSFSDRRLAKFRRITRGTVATAAGPVEAVRLATAARRGSTPRSAPVAYQLPFDSRVIPLDVRLVETAHAAGAHVHAWTVNEAADMDRLLDIGVDGITTDRPDTLDDVLRRRSS